MGHKFSPEYEAQLLRQAAERGATINGVRMGAVPELQTPRTFKDEGEFQAAVVKLATEFGWDVYHQYDSRRSKRGWLDLALIRPPRVIFMELKSEDGKLTPEQKKLLNLLEKCDGVRAFVFWPRDFEIIRSLLQ
ncbi:MAG TPA: hypothetical protein VNT76_05935 [Candidatus Binatus sp.]|nr:hypothetical protein [Candidatus Binatus sp.]